MPDPIKNPLPPKCIVLLCFVLLLFSSCLTQEQRKQKAIEYGQKGLEAANNQQYNKSLTYYNQGIDLDSTNSALFLAIGNVMYQIGDTTKALYNYKKVLSLNISDSTMYNNTLCNLGILYLEKKELDSSIFFTQKLLFFNPNSLDAYLTLGIVYFNLKKYDSALHYLQMVSLKYDIAIGQEKYIRYAYSNYNLKVIRAMSYFYEGLCYKYLGNTKQAQDYLSLAMRDGIEGAQDSLNTLLK